MKKIVASVLGGLFLAGCASTGQELTQDRPLNMFISLQAPTVVANTIFEMSKYCRTTYGARPLSPEPHPTLRRITLDYVTGASYFMRVEVDETGSNQSKVSVYHYHDNDITRGMARQIEAWVNSGSKQCAKGF